MPPRIPRLSTALRKGQCGRVGVVGGSAEYTGAPFYAAMSALRTGADLALLWTAPEAAGPIKTYSPELIVFPALADADVSRVHSLVVGPGLGRSADALDAAAAAIGRAVAADVPVVVDADALWLVAQRPDVVRGCGARVVLTPNAVELGRLPGGEDAAAVAAELGVTVLAKGAVDELSLPGDSTFQSFQYAHPAERTCPRRCGGQGDVLAGAVGAFLAWSDGSPAADAEAVLAACRLTKTAAWRAWVARRRAMTGLDVVNEVGEAFQELWPSPVWGTAAAGAES